MPVPVPNPVGPIELDANALPPMTLTMTDASTAKEPGARDVHYTATGTIGELIVDINGFPLVEGMPYDQAKIELRGIPSDVRARRAR